MEILSTTCSVFQVLLLVLRWQSIKVTPNIKKKIGIGLLRTQVVDKAFKILW